MDYDKEARRQRDLWCMAIGAGMADETLRARMVGYIPSELVDLAVAVRQGNAKSGWAALKAWGVTKANGERAIERIFAELDAIERDRVRTHAVNEVARLSLEGDWDGVKAKVKELGEILNGKS